MKYILVLILILSTHAKAEERLKKDGYLQKTSKGEIYFMKKPGLLLSGNLVRFESKEAEFYGCILTKLTQPYDCPLQEISYVEDIKDKRLILTKARVENTNTPWHEMKRAEKIFGD